MGGGFKGGKSWWKGKNRVVRVGGLVGCVGWCWLVLVVGWLVLVGVG